MTVFKQVTQTLPLCATGQKKERKIDPPQIHTIGPANVAVKLSASAGYCGQLKMTTVSVKKKNWLYCTLSFLFFCVLIVCK